MSLPSSIIQAFSISGHFVLLQEAVLTLPTIIFQVASSAQLLSCSELN